MAIDKLIQYLNAEYITANRQKTLCIIVHEVAELFKNQMSLDLYLSSVTATSVFTWNLLRIFLAIFTKGISHHTLGITLFYPNHFYL